VSKSSTPLTLAASFPLALATLALAPADFAGSPTSFKAGTANTAAVWEADGGLHVRFTSDGSEQRYSGKVCGKDKVDGLVAFENEGQDSIWIGPEGKCVWFKFVTRGGVDGFDIRAGGKVVFFDLRRASAGMPPESIWIGSGNRHPEHSPFTLQRE
jgi:hypothetical protein